MQILRKESIIRMENKKVEKIQSSGAREWRARNPGSDILRTYMTLCGLESVGGDTS
jgi:hypothetical protein